MRVPNVDGHRRKVRRIVEASCAMRVPRIDPKPVLRELEGMKLPRASGKLINLLDALISTQEAEIILDGYDPYGFLERPC